MKSKFTKVLFFLSLATAIICGGIFIFNQISQKNSEKALNDAIASQPQISSDLEESTEDDDYPEEDVKIEVIETEDELQITIGESESTGETLPKKPTGGKNGPVDFDYWQNINPDVYAYLKINGTGQEFPVLRNLSDNDYYLRKDINKNYYVGGSLYTQFVYNSDTFTDACTIIYGHHMPNGTMFGKLEDMSMGLNLTDSSDNKNYFYIYTPSKTFKYKIACAGVFGSDHILYYHDFNNEDSFNSFFTELYNYGVGERNCPESTKPEFGTKLLILDTCYKKDYNYRYIVVGALVSEE